MGTYLIDALMIGRLPDSANAIAASSLAGSLYGPVLFCGVGLIAGVNTQVSRAHGAGEPSRGLRAFIQALWLIGLWIPLTHLLMHLTRPLLVWDGVEKGLLAPALEYLEAGVWATAPLLLALALRQYLQSVGRTFCIFLALVVSNLVNVVADWALMFGHLGSPALGLTGAAWANVLVRISMLAVLFIAFVWHLYVDDLRIRAAMWIPRGGELKVLLALGWAPAIQTLFDLGVSSFQGLLCGQLGGLALAANQVVLDVSAFVYMFSSGISGATGALVGHAAGVGDREGVRERTWAGARICVLWTFGTGLAFLLIPQELASVYTTDVEVMAMAVPCFALSALYQPFDAWEACLGASLCGMGDTRTPMFAGVFWSWVIGGPLTWLLAIHCHLGLAGLFIGRGIPAALTALTVWTFWPRRVRSLV